MGAKLPKRIHVKPTLRGLVVTDHRKNPPERVGEVIAYRGLSWLRLELSRFGARTPGTPLGSGPKYIVSGERAFNTALRAQRRELWRAIRRGEVSPEFQNTLGDSRAWRLGGFSLAASVFFIGWVHFKGGSFADFTSDHAAAGWGRVGLAGGVIYALAGALIVSSTLIVNGRRDHFVKLMRDAVLVKTRTDAGRLIGWDKLVSVSRTSSGFLLDFGREGKVRPPRGEHFSVFRVLLDPDRERQRARAFGRRAAIAILVAGAVLAVAPPLVYGSYAAVGGPSNILWVAIWSIFCAAVICRGGEPWERLALRCRGMFRAWRRRSTGSPGEQP